MADLGILDDLDDSGETREQHVERQRRTRWIELIRPTLEQAAKDARTLSAFYNINRHDNMRRRHAEIRVDRWNWLLASLGWIESKDLEEWATGDLSVEVILARAEYRYGSDPQALIEYRAQKAVEDDARAVDC